MLKKYNVLPMKKKEMKTFYTDNANYFFYPTKLYKTPEKNTKQLKFRDNALDKTDIFDPRANKDL